MKRWWLRRAKGDGAHTVSLLRHSRAKARSDVPAIHVFASNEESQTWMPGSSPGMTPEIHICPHRRVGSAAPSIVASNTGEASGEWLHNGLSDLGKQVIAEMNRVGIMVDLSHPSKQANLQAIALSKAPVIASHSAARALCDHSRDLDDEQLLAIKKNGGVVQTVAFASYVKTPLPPTAERQAALSKLETDFGLPAGSLGRGGRGGRGRGATAGAGTAAPRMARLARKIGADVPSIDRCQPG